MSSSPLSIDPSLLTGLSREEIDIFSDIMSRLIAQHSVHQSHPTESSLNGHVDLASAHHNEALPSTNHTPVQSPNSIPFLLSNYVQPEDVFHARNRTLNERNTAQDPEIEVTARKDKNLQAEISTLAFATGRAAAALYHASAALNSAEPTITSRIEPVAKITAPRKQEQPSLADSLTKLLEDETLGATPVLGQNGTMSPYEPFCGNLGPPSIYPASLTLGTHEEGAASLQVGHSDPLDEHELRLSTDSLPRSLSAPSLSEYSPTAALTSTIDSPQALSTPQSAGKALREYASAMNGGNRQAEQPSRSWQMYGLATGQLPASGLRDGSMGEPALAQNLAASSLVMPGTLGTIDEWTGAAAGEGTLASNSVATPMVAFGVPDEFKNEDARSLAAVSLVIPGTAGVVSGWRGAGMVEESLVHNSAAGSLVMPATSVEFHGAVTGGNHQEGGQVVNRSTYSRYSRMPSLPEQSASASRILSNRNASSSHIPSPQPLASTSYQQQHLNDFRSDLRSVPVELGQPNSIPPGEVQNSTHAYGTSGQQRQLQNSLQSSPLLFNSSSQPESSMSRFLTASTQPRPSTSPLSRSRPRKGLDKGPETNPWISSTKMRAEPRTGQTPTAAAVVGKGAATAKGKVQRAPGTESHTKVLANTSYEDMLRSMYEHAVVWRRRAQARQEQRHAAPETGTPQQVLGPQPLPRMTDSSFFSTTSTEQPFSASRSMAACLRLYEHAKKTLRRREEAVEKELAAERARHTFSAPRARHVSPRVYEPRLHPSLRALRESLPYSFHPQTNYRKHCRRPRPVQENEEQCFDDEMGLDMFILPSFSHRSRSAPQSHHPSEDPSTPLWHPPDMSTSSLGGATPVIARSSASGSADPTRIAPEKSTSKVPWAFSDRLDWGEFITRQARFLEAKEEKLEKLRSPPRQGPHLSPGTLRILAGKSPSGSASGAAPSPPCVPYTETSSRQPAQPAEPFTPVRSISFPESPPSTKTAGQRSFRSMRGAAVSPMTPASQQVPSHALGSHGSLGLLRSPYSAPVPGLSQGGAPSLRHVSPPSSRSIMKMLDARTKELTFKPQITPMARALPPTPLEDLVDGGRARKEVWRAREREMADAAELQEATFHPRIKRSPLYSQVRPRINMHNLDQYAAAVAARQRAREEAAAAARQQRELDELAECTFCPSTTPLPSFILEQLVQSQGPRPETMLGHHMAALGGIPDSVVQERPAVVGPTVMGSSPVDQSAWESALH